MNRLNFWLFLLASLTSTLDSISTWLCLSHYRGLIVRDPYTGLQVYEANPVMYFLIHHFGLGLALAGFTFLAVAVMYMMYAYSRRTRVGKAVVMTALTFVIVGHGWAVINNLSIYSWLKHM